MAWAVLGFGVLLGAALGVRTALGEGGIESAWLGVPAVAAVVLLVAAPLAALRRDEPRWLGRTAGIAGATLLGSVALGLLVAPSEWADPTAGGRTPDTVAEARVLGLLIGVPVVSGAAWWWWSSRRGRARQRDAEALLQRLRRGS